MLISNTWKHVTLCKQTINIKLDRNDYYIELLMLKQA